MNNCNPCIVNQDQPYLVTRSALLPEDIIALAEGQIGALSIPNFYAATHCTAAESQLLSNFQYYENAPSIGRCGMAYYETNHRPSRIEHYYNTAQSNMEKIRQFFAPHLSPMDLLRLKLQEIWVPGANIENIDGRKMFVGLCRVVESGVDFLPHQDNLSFDAPHSTVAKSLVAQFAANVYLSIGENGGELEMWDKEFDKATFDRLRNGVYGIERSLLPKAHYTHQPKTGELVIFNARRLHAVRRTESQSRLSIATFIGYRGRQQPLTYWS